MLFLIAGPTDRNLKIGCCLHRSLRRVSLWPEKKEYGCMWCRRRMNGAARLSCLSRVTVNSGPIGGFARNYRPGFVRKQMEARMACLATPEPREMSLGLPAHGSYELLTEALKKWLRRNTWWPVPLGWLSWGQGVIRSSIGLQPGRRWRKSCCTPHHRAFKAPSSISPSKSPLCARSFAGSSDERTFRSWWCAWGTRPPCCRRLGALLARSCLHIEGALETTAE